MSVSSFDPGQQQQAIDSEVVQALITLLGGVDKNTPLGNVPALSADQAAQYAGLAIHPGWAQAATTLADGEIICLVQLFTVGEELYSGWQAGDKSPVVPLVRELKNRGVFDVQLSRWIKANTSNKFLPHGSLLDRL